MEKVVICTRQSDKQSERGTANDTRECNYRIENHDNLSKIQLEQISKI